MKRIEVERAARRLIRDDGLINLTLSTLCYELEIPEGSFTHVTGMKFEKFISGFVEKDTSSKIHSPTKQRVQKDIRKDHILKVATKLAEKRGYIWITRDELAKAAEVSPSLITFHFHSIKALRDELMKKAVAEKNLKIIWQGLANSNGIALRAPIKIKKAALRQLGNVS